MTRIPDDSTVVLRRLALAILALIVPALGCGLAYPIAGAALAAGGGGGGGGAPSRSVQFEVSTAIDLLNAEYVGPVQGIVGPPTIVSVSPNRYQVTMELDYVPPAVPIHFAFRSPVPVMDPGGHDLAIANVQFYPYPPSQIPPGPGPDPPVAGPTFRWRIDSALGIVLDVSNSNNDVSLNVVCVGSGSPSSLDDLDFYYDSPAAEALPWQPLFTGTLLPGQLTTIDLPDDAGEVDPGALEEPAAALVRYLSSANGVEQRGIYQLDLVGGTIDVEEATWGRIKAMFKD